MKILLTLYRKKWQNDIMRTFYFLIKVLIEKYGFHMIDLSNIESASSFNDYLIKKKIEYPTSVLVIEDHNEILINDYFIDFFNGKYKKGVFTDDFHKGLDRKKELKYYNKFDHIFTTYYRPFLNQFSSVNKKKVLWTPHGYCDDFIIDFNENPENLILVSGAMASIYELRELMKEYYKNNKNKLVLLKHPKYRHFNYNNLGDYIVGKEYSKKLNNYIACFTDCATSAYIVSKYFEIPASGSLLLCQDPKEYGANNDNLAELGFIDGETCIICNKNNYIEKINYILDEKNRNIINKIRLNGMNMVLKKHNISNRAEIISNILH